MHDLDGLVARWALTYAVHASAFLVLAWAVDRVPRVPDAVRESWWRLTLVGSLLTATVQVAFAVESWSGTWHAELGSLPSAVAPAPVLVPHALDSAGTPEGSAVAWGGWGLVLSVWGAVAAIGLAHLALLYLGLRRQLRPTRPASELDDDVARLTERLCLRRPPRLSVSARAATPLALGLLRPEICVPERALHELDLAELRAMLAHELAHVRRRDPAWALLYALVCRVLFWHPATWLARHRLLALAETRCDALARGSAPGAGLALARALLHVAEWLAPRPGGLGAAHGRAMASSCSGLQRRVRLLLAEPRSGRSGPGWRGQAALCVLLAGAPFLLPAVAAAERVAPADSADLPAPLAGLVRDVALLRDEVLALRQLAVEAGLADDPAVGDLLREIDLRLDLIVARCASVVRRHRHPSETDPLLPR